MTVVTVIAIYCHMITDLSQKAILLHGFVNRSTQPDGQARAVLGIDTHMH